MHILHNTYAVFWSRKGWNKAFHADQVANTASEAYQRFVTAFPNDIVRSIRDKSGKFQAFKESSK